MSRNLYRGYLAVCEKWGTDPSKRGRDLGEYLRKQVALEFRQGDATEFNNMKECEEKLESLRRLASGYHDKQFVKRDRATSSGLTIDEIKDALSTDGLEYINSQQLRVRERLKFSISKFFNKSTD